MRQMKILLGLYFYLGVAGFHFLCWLLWRLIWWEANWSPIGKGNWDVLFEQSFGKLKDIVPARSSSRKRHIAHRDFFATFPPRWTSRVECSVATVGFLALLRRPLRSQCPGKSSGWSPVFSEAKSWSPWLKHHGFVALSSRYWVAFLTGCRISSRIRKHIIYGFYDGLTPKMEIRECFLTLAILYSLIIPGQQHWQVLFFQKQEHKSHFQS